MKNYGNLYFADECKRKLVTEIKRVITKRGTKPTIRIQRQYQGYYVLAAWNAQTKEAVVVLSKHFNSHVFMKLLYKVKEKHGKGRLMMIVDNHSAHKTERVRYLAKKKGIHLEYLPKYSPDLNPVELIWKSLKHELSNRIFDSMEELERAIRQFFEQREYKIDIDIDNFFN